MMGRLEGFASALKAKWFPSENDKAWKRWVDFRNRDPRDLRMLLNMDVKEEFKRRALFLLMVPSYVHNPIYWRGAVGGFFHGSDLMEGLSQELLAYAAGLVTEFVAMLRPLHRDRPRHSSYAGAGILMRISVQDKHHDALCFYNGLILKLLSSLPREFGEKLFPLFSLRDISTFCDMDQASGYHPFLNLMSSDADEEWKRLADAEMRRIIDAETNGRAQPREEWEDALRWYAEMIQMQVSKERLGYPVALFANQMEYLVSEQHRGRHLINRWQLGKLFRLLPGDGHADLRHRISRFVVFENGSEFQKFSVHNEADLETARRMLAESGKSDSELADRLAVLIQEGNDRMTEESGKESARESEEKEILDAMR